jgi:predicted GTPase
VDVKVAAVSRNVVTSAGLVENFLPWVRALTANTHVVTRDVVLRNWKQKQSGRLSRGISE